MNFNKCTIVSNYNNFTFHMVAHFEVGTQGIPWVRSELLQAESDALLLFVEVENNNVDFLVELNNFVWVVDASPRKVGNVNESINTAEVNEYAVRSDVLDNTFEDLTLFEVRDDFLALCFELCFDECFV